MSDYHNGFHAKKFYVTTPIYYVTAKPHLGSLYSTLLADVATRWHKVRGYKTHFLTGTDEHGQKIAQAAQNAGKEPKEFVDGLIDTYKDMWHKYEIAYDIFGRTTSESHLKAVQQWIQKLLENGDIYKAFYSGYYCTPCETYVTEKEDVTLKEGESPKCQACERLTQFLSEESYFFRLSKYQDRLLAFYEENPDFVVPNERIHEVLSFVKAGLKDLSISRTSVSWGIPFPGDPRHVVYVWAEALQIYISSVGYGNEARKDDFNFWWPADMQVMGKDIIRFHAVFWPAFLMAAELPLPKQLLVHGWIKVNNQKMSKSFGNVIDPQTLLDVYGACPVRYYLIRQMAITQDSEFSTIDLEQKITSDLAHDLGNLLNRMVTLADKHHLFEVKPPEVWNAQEVDLRDSLWTMLQTMSIDMEEGYFYRGLQTLWKFISQVNAYFHASEPWKITDKKRFEEVISATTHSLHAIGIVLFPVMPSTMEKLLKSIGVTLDFNAEHDYIEELKNNPWNKHFMLSKIPTLFQKYESQEQAITQQSAQANVQASMQAGTQAGVQGTTPTGSKNEGQRSSNQPIGQGGATEQPVTSTELPTITIDDFAKVALIVGTIEQCDEIAGSDKLLKLQVNFGNYGMRQILSGVKLHFAPSDLLHKQAVFVFNLAPRKMMGLESQGMLLTAEDENKRLKIVAPTAQVANGTRLK